jgi:hypothetical protein
LSEVADGEVIDGVVYFFTYVLRILDIGVSSTVDTDIWLVGVEKGIYCFAISNIKVISIDADHSVVRSVEALEFGGEHAVGSGEEYFQNNYELRIKNYENLHVSWCSLVIARYEAIYTFLFLHFL